MRKCGGCFFFSNGAACGRISGYLTEADATGCPLYVSREGMSLCDSCGQPILGLRIFDQGKILCENCSNLYHTCRTCAHGNECPFETDPSPLPKQIVQQTRQGNMVMQQTIPNPARIDITCKTQCKCYNEEFGCCKQTLGCCPQDNYSCSWRTE